MDLRRWWNSTGLAICIDCLSQGSLISLRFVHAKLCRNMVVDMSFAYGSICSYQEVRE